MGGRIKWSVTAILLLGLAVALGNTTGRAAGQARATQSAVEIEQIVIGLKHNLVQAYIWRDVLELERIYVDDFTVTDAQGETRTKADEIASLKGGATTLTTGHYDAVKVRVFGDVAVMSGHGELEGIGQTGHFHTRYYSFNVFVKRDGHWQYAAAFTP